MWINNVSPHKTIMFFDHPTQLDAQPLAARHDHRSMILKYLPDEVPFLEILLRDDVAVQRLWMNSHTSRPVRWRPRGDFKDQIANVNFGTDLKLISFGVDALVEEAIRVRLDWQIASDATQPITIRLRFDDGTEVHNTFEPLVFLAGNYSTYHLLTGSRDAKLLHVAVITNGSKLADHALPLKLN
jgi:hypothetical protein